MPVVSPQRLLTIPEVAERLGLTPRGVRDKIKRRVIPAVQLGGPRTAIRVDERELEQWLYGRGAHPDAGNRRAAAEGWRVKDLDVTRVRR